MPGFVRPPDLDDRVLLNRVIDRDREALILLFRRHAGRILPAVRRVAGSKKAAERAIEDVFVELWERPQAYLRHAGLLAVRLKWAAQARCGAPVAVVKPPSAGAGTDWRNGVACESPDQMEKLRKEFERLPEAEKTALALTVFEGLNGAEVSSRLGESLETVQGRLRSAMSRMRHIIRRCNDLLLV